MRIDDDLTRLGAAPEITRLVRRVAFSHGLTPKALGDRIRLHPDAHAATAVFVRRRSLDIATDPHVAAAVAARIPGARLVSTSPATTMVRVDARAVAEHGDEVHDQIVRALDWRAAGPQRPGAVSSRAAASPAPAVCPLGHQLSASGACFCD